MRAPVKCLCAIYKAFALVLGELRERVQLGVFVEACADDSFKVVTQTFRSRLCLADCSLGLARGLRRNCSEALGSNGGVRHLIAFPVAAAFCIRMQRLVDLLASGDDARLLRQCIGELVLT